MAFQEYKHSFMEMLLKSHIKFRNQDLNVTEDNIHLNERNRINSDKVNRRFIAKKKC